MKTEEITSTLEHLFGSAVQIQANTVWHVQTDQLRLLVLLSDDLYWLRVLIPVTTAQDAEPFLEQLLEANFDETQETRYAIHQGVLWAVFHHARESLDQNDFTAAIARVIALHQQGLTECFNKFVENRVSQIIQGAKRQGQSLQATMQTLERFYEEGFMGDMAQGAEAREQVLGAWRQQLEKLWNQVEP